MTQSNEKDIHEQLQGKTIEHVQFGVKTMTFKFTDGSYLDVEMINDKSQSEKWQHQLSAKLSDN